MFDANLECFSLSLPESAKSTTPVCVVDKDSSTAHSLWYPVLDVIQQMLIRLLFNLLMDIFQISKEQAYTVLAQFGGGRGSLIKYMNVFE